MKMKEILANAEIEKMPEADTKNLSGHDAYELPKELKLLSLLNTTKLEPEYCRTQSDIVEYLNNLISEVASEDPYFVAQAIIYSRCVRDGMRSINSLAAALLSNYISGTSWAKRFYSAWDKKTQTGGVVFRLDDMKEIKDAYAAFHISELSNAMKKGFASVLENSSLYALSKYKKTVIDISNLVHPKARLSPKVTIDNKEYSAIDAILKNLPVKAETWESKNTESGQEVSDLLKSGEINEEELEDSTKPVEFTMDTIELDSGVNNAHPLIAQALPDSRMSTAINVQDHLDHIDHGTGMAGLVLMGDLTKLAYDRGNLPVVQHNLASVIENKKVSLVDNKSNNDGTYDNDHLVSNFTEEELRLGAQRPLTKDEIQYYKSLCRYAYMSEQDVIDNRCEYKQANR